MVQPQHLLRKSCLNVVESGLLGIGHTQIALIILDDDLRCRFIDNVCLHRKDMLLLMRIRIGASAFCEFKHPGNVNHGSAIGTFGESFVTVYKNNYGYLPVAIRLLPVMHMGFVKIHGRNDNLRNIRS